jgi:hypothetical protein
MSTAPAASASRPLALTKRQQALLFEAALAALVVWSVVKVALFYKNNGYLPQPYFFDANDTFMDWFNVTIYAHNPGAYDQYNAVYPPLSFLVTRWLSVASCYRYDAFFARSCDWLFPWVFAAFFILNTWLTFVSFRRRDGMTALPRTVALSLGLPMLFGYERGQLVIICFTFFVIAHGGAIRWRPLRWFSAGMTINFKPYLILGLAPYLAKRRWRAFEASVIATLLIYAVTYGVIGHGTPLELLRNIQNFDELPTIIKFQNTIYQTSYKGLLDGLRSSFPFMNYIGSAPIDLTLSVVPVLTVLGQALAALCVLAAAWRPNAIPMHRLVALAISISLTASLVGGYSSIFLFFLVFMERGRDPASIAAIVCAYALCVSSEVMLVPIGWQVELSYLSQQVVGYEVGVNLGEIVRPGIVLLIQFLLVVVSAQDLWKARQRSVRPPEMAVATATA